MLVSKLVPLVVMGGIAAHSGGAIKERMAGAMGVADKVVTRQRMTAIIEAATVHAAAGEPVEVGSPRAFKVFVKKAVRIKGNAKADASVDQWGTPLKCELKGQLIALVSAGPDKKFGSKDDIKASGDIYDF
jgi:hypothetical protein